MNSNLKTDLLKIILTLCLTTASLFSVVLLWRYNIILFTSLTIIAFCLLAMERSSSEFLTFVFCAFAGPTAEAIAILSGAWNYTNPNLLIIPIWLSVLWGIASVCIVRIYLFFSSSQ